jgi:hypothetical protein
MRTELGAWFFPSLIFHCSLELVAGIAPVARSSSFSMLDADCKFAPNGAIVAARELLLVRTANDGGLFKRHAG